MRKISKILTILVLGCFLINSIAKPLQSSKVVIALNCGSKSQQVSTSEGSFKYVPDEQYVRGSSVGVDYHNDAVANDAQIKFALDKEIYMYERHTYEQMIYELPVRKGVHTIILKFAEMYFQKPGQRVFNVKIGNTIVLENFDVIEKSGGKFAAHEQYIQIEVKQDGVYYQGRKLTQAISNNKLLLSFAKGRADNPIIQAIIVYHDSIQNSPKQEFQNLKSKWSSQQEMLKAKKEEKQLKELIAIQKKKEKIIIRNDQLLLDEEQGTQTKTQSTQQPQKFGFLRRLLMGPLGLIAWSVLFGYLFMFCYQKVFRMGPLPKVVKNQ